MKGRTFTSLVSYIYMHKYIQILQVHRINACTRLNIKYNTIFKLYMGSQATSKGTSYLLNVELREYFTQEEGNLKYEI